MAINSEDMVQVANQIQLEVFRDLRVCSQCVVIAVHDNMVDVQPTVADVSNNVVVPPPVVKNLRVVGSSSMLDSGMPKVGDAGVILHFDRRNNADGEMQVSGGPAHEIGFGVFLPLV